MPQNAPRERRFTKAAAPTPRSSFGDSLQREYLGAELVCVSESNSVTKGMKENERLNNWLLIRHQTVQEQLFNPANGRLGVSMGRRHEIRLPNQGVDALRNLDFRFPFHCNC
jgi:hypothetical protein